MQQGHGHYITGAEPGFPTVSRSGEGQLGHGSGRNADLDFNHTARGHSMELSQLKRSVDGGMGGDMTGI